MTDVQASPPPVRTPVAPRELAVLHQQLAEWYVAAARELPWRGDDVSPWAVLVSEFMLQQTPVARVQPVFEAWLARWPNPAALAAESSGEAVRAWGRLGYPRRALRLHAAAQAIVADHGGQVPGEVEVLRTLPGVGEYTAAAVACFGFGVAVAVLDTNVRRVFARVLEGREFPPAHLTTAERRRAVELLPDADALVPAPLWSIAVMEFGALVCGAARPKCEICPIANLCQWRSQGYPQYDGPVRRGQDYAGTDRQCRGRLLGLLRETPDPVAAPRLDLVWEDDEQRSRCLASLVTDGLVVESSPGWYALP